MDGRRELQDWQRKMPDDRFRLIKYIPANAQISGGTPSAEADGSAMNGGAK